MTVERRDAGPELGVATWVPSGDRWLYAQVHRPADGQSQGGVVLVGSIGREHVIAFRALRRLAVELARAGYTVVRPHLTGVAESSLLPEDVDPCAVWTEDIDASADYLRTALGQDVVHGIGLRLGADLLAHATRVDGRRVYWEAVAGKRWLRGQAILRTVSIDVPPVEDEGWAEVPGAIFSPTQARGLESLRRPRPEGDDVVYDEPDPDDAMRLHSTVTLFARVPLASIHALVDLVPRGTPAPLPAWSPAVVAELRDPTDGSLARETLVEVGPDRLCGVLTEPVEPVATGTGPLRSLVFASGSAEPKEGPTALWVQIARRAAQQGHVSLRVDRRGTGDMGHVEELADQNPYVPEGVPDLQHAAAYMRERFGRPVTGIGFCSGSWIIMSAAVGGAFDHVIGIAQGAWRRGERYYAKISREVLVAATDNQAPPVVASDAALDPQAVERPAVRVKGWLRQHLPYTAWRELGRHDKATCPEHLLADAAARARITLLFGDGDREFFDFERGQESLRMLERRGLAVETEDLGRLDHALLAHTGRVTVIDRVLRLLG